VWNTEIPQLLANYEYSTAVPPDPCETDFSSNKQMLTYQPSYLVAWLLNSMELATIQRYSSLLDYGRVDRSYFDIFSRTLMSM
jgi:hypothetical protein